MTTPDIFTIDPGATSGWAFWSEDTFRSGELPFTQMIDHVEKWMYESYQLGHTGVVMCERFTVTQRTVTTSHHDVNWSIETIGAVRWLAHRYEQTFGLLNASDCKSFAPDKLLKLLGWYVPGSGHANDAARVLALAMSQLDRKFWKALILPRDILTGDDLL